MYRSQRRIFALTTAVIITLTALVLVVFSPLALQAIASFPNLDWGKLSNVGQTYGAVSALLAAIAIVGVALSVLLQLRETRFNRLESGRSRHHELLRMAMENPLYLGIFVYLQISHRA
jgi:hypothetical protein